MLRVITINGYDYIKKSMLNYYIHVGLVVSLVD